MCIYAYMHICIYAYMYVCVCVCASARARVGASILTHSHTKRETHTYLVNVVRCSPPLCSLARRAGRSGEEAKGCRTLIPRFASVVQACNVCVISVYG